MADPLRKKIEELVAADLIKRVKALEQTAKPEPKAANKSSKREKE